MSSFVFSLATAIVADETVAALSSAAGILRRDMAAVLTGLGPANAIVLTRDDSLPEQAWRMTVTPERITLYHRDALGGVYGLLHLSEQALGIAPLWFWNDQPLPAIPVAEIPCGTVASPTFAVRYRGWFINDEVLLDPWKQDEAEHREVWRMAFEAILRCGGNMVIPGTDRHGDGLDMLASDMGLILTQHHAELLGAEMFGRRWPDLQASYRLYPEKFEQLWREAAERLRGRKVIYAIGFRGQGDGPFWGEDGAFDTDGKRGALVSQIMRRQMEIVRAVEPDALFCTNLYGEMMHLYRCGALQVPDGVIKIWADNGYGRMLSRRQGNDNPRVDAMPRHESGRNGIYYHAGFYDLQAANHLTQLQIPPAMIAEELNRVLEGGADDYWIINCGSIKPHLYILDLIRQAWTEGAVDAAAHAENYALRYFGDRRVAPLLTGYGDCAAHYGPHPDDLAGDQYYHHAARLLCWQLMRGETAAVPALRWAEKGDTVFDQARGLGDKCADSLPRWETFIRRGEALLPELSAEAARLMEETLLMNARIHRSGCRMLILLAEAFAAYARDEIDMAFLRAGEAMEEAEEGYRIMRAAEHGKWANFYANDCFANLRLTADNLRSLRGWLRVCGDGPNFWLWERKWLMDPRDVRICLQTHRHCQLSDDELQRRMRQIIRQRAKAGKLASSKQ